MKKRDLLAFLKIKNMKSKGFSLVLHLPKNYGKIFQFKLQRFWLVKQNDFQFNLTREKPGFQCRPK